MNYKLEIIGYSIEACITAQACGAHRVELCCDPASGGTTPSYGLIKAARENLKIPLYPIIRPRGGDFLFTKEAFEIMQSDVLICKQLGCDGVVIGMLHADGSIDKKRCSQLVNLAYPMGVTFHRAFDRVSDAAKALEDIIEIGCERVLTSGLVPKALDGTDTIAALVKQAAGRVIVMPGSGIRSGNIEKIAKETGATEFHSSAAMFLTSTMNHENSCMKEDLQIPATDGDEIKKMLAVLQQLGS